MFLIFDADVKDPAAYQPFLLTAVKEVTAQGGRFIVRGTKPDVILGYIRSAYSEYCVDLAVERQRECDALVQFRCHEARKGCPGEVHCHASFDR